MRTVTIREFLRGGYVHLKGPTVVSRYGQPLFTVFPGIRRLPITPAPLVAGSSADGEHDASPEEVPPEGSGE